MSAIRIDPRLRVLYLAGVAIGIFFLSQPRWVGFVAIVQVLLWFLVGLSFRDLLRQLAKLWLFGLLIVLSYALTAQDPQTDRWIELSIAGAGISLNLAGLSAGLVMLLRLATVVLVSQVVRVGDQRAISSGLRTLGLPRSASISIDTVLALFGERGQGRGGGRRRHQQHATQGFWASVKRLAAGDVDPIVNRLERQISRAEQHARQQDLGRGGHDLARDVGVVAGISLTMLGVRALRVLPSVPFAPGHKLVILTPLYIVAGMLTRSRFGSTLTGTSMGSVSFLMGQGRYGIFEIIKHVVPGAICDLCLPALTAGGRMPGGLVWCLFGGLIAAGRFASIVAMTFVVQAPAVAYAILVPGFVVHITFGLFSGYVTYHLVRGVRGMQAGYEKTGSEVIG